MAFPDVVSDLITHLDPVDGTVPVRSETPDSFNAGTDEQIIIRRVGGSALMPVRDVNRLDVWAWAATAPRARALLYLVRSQIWDLAGTTALGYQVYKVAEFMGPTQRDDTEIKAPRCWYRPELTVRADDVIHLAPSP